MLVSVDRMDEVGGGSGRVLRSWWESLGYGWFCRGPDKVLTKAAAITDLFLVF